MRVGNGAGVSRELKEEGDSWEIDVLTSSGRKSGVGSCIIFDAFPVLGGSSDFGGAVLVVSVSGSRVAGSSLILGIS